MRRQTKTPQTMRSYLAALKKTGVSQNEVAAQLGLSPGFLSDLKNGKQTPSLGLALRLQREAGIPIESWAEAHRSLAPNLSHSESVTTHAWKPN